MILNFRNTSAVCAVFLLVSVGNFHKSAIATVNNQSQLIAQQSKTPSNPVFKSILPKLKQKTQIKILLPKFIPESDGENPIYAIIEAATQKNTKFYWVSVPIVLVELPVVWALFLLKL